MTTAFGCHETPSFALSAPEKLFDVTVMSIVAIGECVEAAGVNENPSHTSRRGIYASAKYLPLFSETSDNPEPAVPAQARARAYETSERFHVFFPRMLLESGLARFGKTTRAELTPFEV